MANKGNSKKYQETALTCVIIIATVTHRVQLHYKILWRGSPCSDNNNNSSAGPKRGRPTRSRIYRPTRGGILVLSIEIFRLDVNIDVNIAKTRPVFRVKARKTHLLGVETSKSRVLSGRTTIDAHCSPRACISCA